MMKKSRLVMSAVALTAALSLASDGLAIAADAVFGNSISDTDGVEIQIDTELDRQPISKYIYGLNDVYDMSGVTVFATKKSDMAVSSYNWEINASNSGAADNYRNSLALVPAALRSSVSPGQYAVSLVNDAKKFDIPSRYVTLQMMGFVANDSQGAVSSFDTEHRWASVSFNKNDSYLFQPNIHDNTVFMDEYLSYLANIYGFAADGGINGYFLDNEPELWDENYAILGLAPITAEELTEKSSALSRTIKSIDPTALVYGPSVKNLEAFVNLGNAEDWESYSSSYSWFIDSYLDNMKKASDAAGTRLLDVLDLHFISEAKSVILEPIIGSDSVFANEERVQAVRVLWDSDYTENSQTAIVYKQHTPLIPTLQASIRMYYPDTKLSFSEYNFGGGDNISGGIAQADVLGIFGEQNVYMACLLPDNGDYAYQKAGINIYTNYDGNGASFGNTSVSSDNGNDHMSSVHASITDGDDTTLRAVLINKNKSSDKQANVVINSPAEFTSARVYRFDGESAEIAEDNPVEDIEDNCFSFTMSPMSVYMLEFSAEIPPVEEIIEDTESVTEAEPEETEFVPEHVEVSTPAPETTPSALSPEETVPEEATTSVSVIGTDNSGEVITEIITEPVTAGTEPAPQEKPAEDDEDEADSENSSEVPPALKIITIILLAAVAAVIVYILVTDNKKDGGNNQ